MKNMYQSWLFQTNPDHHEFACIRRTSCNQYNWIVKEHRDDIKLGDRVFIWKASGKKREVRGIVGHGKIAGPLRSIEHHSGLSCWKKEHGATVEIAIGDLTILREADWITTAKLEDHLILKDWAKRSWRGTNFKITNKQADCLEEMIRHINE